MILVIIILILCGPALVRSAEASARIREAERRQAERAAELQRGQAERIQKTEQRRERITAEARTVIEFWEPRRRDLIRRINAEQDTRRRERLETQLFQVEQRLQKAYWTLEN